MRSLFFNCLCPLLFLSLSTFHISAQVNEDVPVTNLGTVTNNGEGMYIPFEFCLDEGNTLTVKVNVLLGDLFIVEGPNGPYGIIPPGIEDMYIEFTIGGVIYAPQQVGNFDLVTLENGASAFSYIAESPTVDFSEECENSEDGIIYTNVSYRLVTPDGSGGYDVYPACNYSGLGGMFSCNIYSYAPWCDAVPVNGFGAPDDPTPNCYHEWFSGGYTAKMHCDCDEVIIYPPREEDHIIDDGDYIKSDENDITNRNSLEININVYPNPVDNILHIESEGKYISQVDIFDSKGQLMLSKKYNFDNNQNISLNTSSLPNGLYLARIATNMGIEVVKVLK